jgi:2-succinyl-6-hydroxy-2,4-cyclohexadiene-1-carboxylate synthase
MEAVARDVEALLDHLQASPAHLLGYSMGGRLSLYLALHRPRRWISLILESASPGLATAAERARRAQKDEALAAFIEREGLPAFVDRWQALPLFASQKRLPQDVRQAHREGRLRNRSRGLANSLRGMGTGVQPSLWPRLGELALPVLLVAGELDDKFVAIAQEMAAELSRVRLEIVPDAGHTVHLERPDYYEHLLRRWLSEQD